MTTEDRLELTERLLRFLLRQTPKAVLADIANSTHPEAAELRRWCEEHR